MRFTKYITNAAAWIVDQSVHNYDVHFSEGGKNASISKTRAVLCKPKIIFEINDHDYEYTNHRSGGGVKQ